MHKTTIRMLRHTSLCLLFSIAGLAQAADTAADASGQTPPAPVFKLPPDKPVTATADAPVTKRPARIVPPPGPALMAPKSGGASTSTAPLIPEASKQQP